ncbi:MAG: ion transporter [Dehalogenimonas sp.]
MSIRRAINRFFEVHEVAWEIFMIGLAIIFVIIVFLPDWAQLSASALNTISTIDWGITLIFIVEFVIRFSAAYSHKGYLKDHWLDLLAIIPLVRWIRVARLIRVIRIMRLLRLGRIIDSLDDLGFNFAHFAKLNGLQWMLLVLTAVMLLGSILIYFTEAPVNDKINTYWDAFYTSALTWVSAGYGDITPVTTVGRILGIILVVSGITTWGLLIGNLSAFLSARSSDRIEKQETDPVINQLKRKITRLDTLSEGELLALQGEIDALTRNRLDKLKNNSGL